MTEIERVFVRFRGRTIGPLTPDKVRDMVRRGQLTRMHELSADGLTWTKAEEFGNFFPRANPGGGSFTENAASVPPGAEGYVDDGATGAPPAPNENASAQWYAHVNGEKQGPISLDQVRLYVEAKVLKKDSLVWKSGMDTWKPASEALPELFGSKKVAASESSSGDSDESDSGGTTIQTELVQNHQVVLLAGIAMIAIAIAVVVSQIMEISDARQRMTPVYMGVAGRLAIGIAAMLAGGLAVNTSLKMKSSSESPSMIQTLLAIRALNQLWLIAGIAVSIAAVVVLGIIVAAVAMQIPLSKVLP